MYLAALPTPGGIQIAGKTPNDGSYEQHISHMQKKINDTIAKNKELYEISPPVSKGSLLWILYYLDTSPVLCQFCTIAVLDVTIFWTQKIYFSLFSFSHDHFAFSAFLFVQMFSF